ncbi:MAG: tetratricopeptide repeat protein [Bacteroidota bacterium]
MMKSLFSFVAIYLLWNTLSAQLFYTDPEKLHQEFRAKYMAITAPSSSSASSGAPPSHKNFQEAKEVGEKLLYKAEKQLWKDHTEMAIYLHNVACLHTAFYQYYRAEQLFRPALDIWAKRIGTEEPQYILTALHLAEGYILEGRPGKANYLLTESYKAINAFMIPDKIYLYENELEAAGHYWAQGDMLAAEYYLIMALRLLPKTSEIDGNHGYILTALGQLYREWGRYPESVGFFKEAWEIWSSQYASMYAGYAYYESQLLRVPGTIDIERYLVGDPYTHASETEDSYHLDPNNRFTSPRDARYLKNIDNDSHVYRSTYDPETKSINRTGVQIEPDPTLRIRPYQGNTSRSTTRSASRSTRTSRVTPGLQVPHDQPLTHEIPLKIKKENMNMDHPKRLISPRVGGY